ncbi:hypothetical protein [Fusibacter tunisiensis]|uniref:ABC transport system permease protein n=1 Tax=Fusibacter tunisiensis TaxID=1008308 RepID=A0ABS2MT61_9FIRM|nr:hypothetical protein [Fusibacter tunisiensis]MBM7562589.1 putative ABC transport system permease protein [Fusibacter tunisiensis]
MLKTIEDLRNRKIISITEMIQIRNHIYQLNSHMPSNAKIQLFVNAVHKVIETHLSGIDFATQATIKDILLHKILVDQQSQLTRYDVFKTIFELELTPEIQLEMAKDWLKETAEFSIRSEELKNFLDFFESVPKSINHRKPIRFMLAFATIIFVILLVSLKLRPPQSSTTTFEPNYSVLSLPANMYVTTIDDPILKSLYGNSFTYLTFSPDPFSFQDFNYFNLKNYLKFQRNSKLSEPEYFNEVIRITRELDVDPLLIFAIAGHEQSFVPLEHRFADEIINNPYNVFQSWEKYNTNFSDSTRIASNTVKNRLKSLPNDASPLVWLNEIYAEDPNWHIGVGQIYKKLNQIARVKRQ